MTKLEADQPVVPQVGPPLPHGEHLQAQENYFFTKSAMGFTNMIFWPRVDPKTIFI